MWYPEEPISYCRRCRLEIPADCFWRGRGFIISSGGGQRRTPILYSLCPECGERSSVGLDGWWAYRILYSWLWKLRYPSVTPPEIEYASQQERPIKRAVGE